MTEQDWQQYTKTLGIFLNGAVRIPHPQREALADDNFYVLINAHYESLDFILPDDQWSSRWLFVFDTDTGWSDNGNKEYSAGEKIRIEARSLSVLRAVDGQPDP